LFKLLKLKIALFRCEELFMKLMVYSHDGLGNIRRMLEICQYLLKAIPDLSILLVSGSPMLQSFRLPPGLDYIKLPCLNRGESGELSAKYLRLDVETTVKLRSDLILTAALSYKPDIMMVDKKPYGMKRELKETLNALKAELPKTKLVLLLRDILDLPETTRAEWKKEGFYSAIYHLFHQVLVVGIPKVFNLCEEYGFPSRVAEKVRFCGYLRKESGQQSRFALRRELNLQPSQKLVLVTPGGGEDGFPMLSNYLKGQHLNDPDIRSLLFCGPEMPAHEQQRLHEVAAQFPQVTIREFTDDMMSYINAADLVVCMGGYNTITEVLSQGKRAIAIPRIKPGHEQFIRASRMANLNLLHQIHPYALTPERLSQAVLDELKFCSPNGSATLDFQGLPRIGEALVKLLLTTPAPNPISQLFPGINSELQYLAQVAS
jgi:predicted glycosyltransferase